MSPAGFPGWPQLGETLRQLREGAGLTGAALAKTLDLSASSVTNYERGHRRIPLDVLFAWSLACGRPLTLVWAPPEADIDGETP